MCLLEGRERIDVYIKRAAILLRQADWTKEGKKTQVVRRWDAEMQLWGPDRWTEAGSTLVDVEMKV